MTRSKRYRRDTSNDGEVWARIIDHKSSYYISRDEIGEDAYRIDDEAQLEIVAAIDAITRTQRKHIGAEFEVSLLAAEKYGPEKTSSTPFFGSVTLRGTQRSALAYMPSRPFWALPELIGGRETWICIGWTSLRRGYAQLNSIFIGDAEDRAKLLELGGSTLAVGASGGGAKSDHSALR